MLRIGVSLAASKQAEVWGCPISHSLSPVLHNKAYELLGLDAHYGTREVTEASLASNLAGIGPDYLGISLTMPLKEAVLELVPDHRGLVASLGAANTLVMGPQGPYLWNADPDGVLGALADGGVTSVEGALVLGAGATARSVIAAVKLLGAREVVVASRDAHRADRTVEYATQEKLNVTWVSLDDVGSVPALDVVASTVPHGVDATERISDAMIARAALLDVTYHPWPSSAALRWRGSSRPVASGLSMLVHQAVVQIRLFTSGDATLPLPAETEIIAAMKHSVGLPAV